ncbi:hypothetical protein [Methylocella sp.]|uniref:hypothetical protein n=1 Tax=Methylocella sp. TaxID=1978226 RepID=UPI0035AEB0CF
MLPKKGRSFPSGTGEPGNLRRYADVISLALKAELGGSRRTIKTVQRWTNASERTVKNWMSGCCGPDGDHLVALLAHSNTVLQMVLIASGRFDLVQIFMERSGLAAIGDQAKAHESENTRKRVFVDDPVRVPVDDLEPDPDERFVPNERQHWFLAQLASGERVSARSLLGQFGVAEKTAKRDIATLKMNGLISFIGTRRCGRYRLRRINLFRVQPD